MTKMKMPDGKDVEAEELDYETESEPWCVYTLSDGTTLKVRPIVNKVLRAIGAFDRKTGDPVYQVVTTDQIRISCIPEHLKKPADVEDADFLGIQTEQV